VIRSNLELVDSEFQESLRKTAIQNGKLKHDYRIPNECTENHQNEIKNFLKPYCGYFKPFPFGSDFTPVEERLAGALAQIKSALPFKHRLAILLWRGLRIPSRRFSAELARMGLENPRHLIEKSYQCLLKAALE
jgi:hypothetical protein